MSGVTNQTPGTEEDKKPATGDQGGAHINLKVKGQVYIFLSLFIDLQIFYV